MQQERQHRKAFRGKIGNYGCRQYELDKVTLNNSNLTADEYEQKIKELAERNRF